LVKKIAECLIASPEGFMNIEEALKEYADKKREMVTPGYREAIALLIKARVSEPLENDSYLDALYLSDIMLSRTKNDLCILTQGAGDFFLKALIAPFEAVLIRIKEVGGKARIIVLDTNVSDLLLGLKDKFSGILDIRTGKAKSDINHMIISDATMVRIEDPHTELKISDDIGKIKAKVYFDNRTEAKKQLDFFDAAWKILNPDQPVGQ